MLDRLETNEKSIIPAINAEKYLLCIMLKSVIYCHMGQTNKALEFNRQAKNFAKENNFNKQLLRLEVEELVVLQDQENFEAIAELSRQLCKNIEETEDHDLLMRYNGTMGQAHCYGFLLQKSQFSQEQAQEFFNKAIEHAIQTDSAPDIAQDLNYLYLWYALFEPTTEQAEKCFQAADSYIKGNLENETQIKNLYFLTRLKGMALYRTLLLTNEVPNCNCRTLELPHDAINWLRVLQNKYLGAIAMAQGNEEQAQNYFLAGKQLDLGSNNSILTFIKMTLLSEAYRSLKKENDRKEALHLAEKLKGIFPSSIPQWINFLQEQGSFPGLNYWY